MNFPHAEKGIKKLVIAQAFAIAATVLLNVPLILINAFDMFGSDVFDMGRLSLWYFILSSLVFALPAQVLTVVLSVTGYVQASRDEKDFRKAMICALANTALVIFGAVFQMFNMTLSTIFSAASTIVEMFAMVYAITALIHLSEQCERDDMMQRGNTLLRVLVTTYIIAAVNALIIRIFELSSKAVIVAVIIGVIDLILNVTQIVLYLIYLKQAAKMLAGAE